MAGQVSGAWVRYVSARLTLYLDTALVPITSDSGTNLTALWLTAKDGGSIESDREHSSTTHSHGYLSLLVLVSWCKILLSMKCGCQKLFRNRLLIIDCHLVPFMKLR